MIDHGLMRPRIIGVIPDIACSETDQEASHKRERKDAPDNGPNSAEHLQIMRGVSV